jgi:hypothetical protein
LRLAIQPQEQSVLVGLQNSQPYLLRDTSSFNVSDREVMFQLSLADGDDIQDAQEKILRAQDALFSAHRRT